VFFKVFEKFGQKCYDCCTYKAYHFNSGLQLTGEVQDNFLIIELRIAAGRLGNFF